MSSLAAAALAVIIIVLPGPPSSDYATPPPAASSSSASAPTSPAQGSSLPDLGGTTGAVVNGVGGAVTGPAGVSLSGWKLTIPKASDKGSAASVDPTSADATPWLHTASEGGGVTFWAPVNGATTPNSQHARTELVSQHTFTAGTGGSHTLSATVAVTQTPSGNPDIILGQIHGGLDIKSVPFVMLHYNDGAITVVVKQAQSGSTAQKYPLISGVALGTRFDYTISDDGAGTLAFSATSGSTRREASAPISQAFRGASVRFQAGDYQQGTGSGASSSNAHASDTGADTQDSDQQDGARVTFFTLTEAHSGGTP